MSKGTVKKDSKKALKQLRTLGDLIYSNSEFRKLLTDANILFRDMFANAVSKATEMAFETVQSAEQMGEDQRPNEDELNNIDNAANGGQQKDKTLPGPYEMKDEVDRVGKDAKKKAKDFKKTAQKKGKKTRDDIQEYLSQKFPKQRQDAIVNRLKKVYFPESLADYS